MVKCSFCSREYSAHEGITLFTNTGETMNFCSSKCRKNWKMGRDKKKLKWTRKEKEGKE